MGIRMGSGLQYFRTTKQSEETTMTNGSTECRGCCMIITKVSSTALYYTKGKFHIRTSKKSSIGNRGRSGYYCDPCKERIFILQTSKKDSNSVSTVKPDPVHFPPYIEPISNTKGVFV